MNSIEALIGCGCSDFSEQSYSTRSECVDLVVKYLFRIVNYKQLKEGFERVAKKLNKDLSDGDQVDFNVNQIREAFTNKGYVIKNVKLWLLYCAKEGLKTSAVTPRREYNIKECDKNLDKMLSDKTVRRIKSLSKKYRVLTLDEIDAVIKSISDETNVWVRKFLNRKLKFVMKGQKIKIDDLHQELLARAIRGLYLMVPLIDSDLHAKNICKQTIKRQGQNIIQGAVTKKRATILRNEENGEFYSNTVSFDAFGVGEKEVALQGILTLKDDLSLDVKNFISGIRSDKKRTFVHLLMGVEHPGFQEYLREQKLLRQFKEITQERFIEVCMNYLEVPVHKGFEFLEDMKTHFKGYKIVTPVTSPQKH